MNNFILDKRLQSDTYPLLDDGKITYLLHKNAEVLWLILVPKSEHKELYQLEYTIQKALYAQINRVSEFLQKKLNADKINVASIGNVVAQLHVHVIGRHIDDAYWPDVIWGKPFSKSYHSARVASIKSELIEFLQHD